MKTDAMSRTTISWALYDWANSAYATTVMAGFFPVFFKQFFCFGTDAVTSTARLGFANAVAGVVIALCAPVLGAIADRGAAKKKFLAFFMFLGVVMTCSLALVAQGQWVLGVFLYIMGTIGFSGGNIFYDSLLPFVAPEHRFDLVSALGFSLGYVGGGLLFAVNIVMILKPAVFGLATPSEGVQWSFVTVGIWWFLFSIPLLLFVKEPYKKKGKPVGAAVREGFEQLRGTFREIRHLKMIGIFLGAYWLYIDGVDTIIRMAVDYGMSIGLEPTDLLKALLITQFIGFPAALGFGFLGERIGTKRAIFLAIAVYLFVTIWAATMNDKREFYLLAMTVGLVQGGIQALSRSFYARIIPANRSAEYFGFYNMVGKFSVVLGPLLIGAMAVLAQSMGYAGHMASRIGIAAVALLFIAGGVLFFFVDEERGKREAGYLSNGI
ncbi:MAG: MFS transporter [Deltaproteobacteria bacterium]|nr:MFS transporter [Deltaproteobacteria bacterium]